MYEFTVWLTGAVALGGALMSYRASRDTFHPLIFLGPMLAFNYALAPLLLINSGVLWNWLPREAMFYVQVYYLLGVLAVMSGVVSAGGPTSKQASAWNPVPALRRQLRLSGLFLGGIGVAAFSQLMSNVGGIEVAYGSAHGEGWAESGYIREAFFMIIPALMLLLMASSGRRLRILDAILIAVIAAPMLLHAVLGANRGPMFMLTITFFVGWYLTQNRRPSMRAMIAVSAGTTCLLFFLLVNRDIIHLGASSDSAFKSPTEAIEFLGRNSNGNEYILGSGVVINSFMTGDYGWGSRYFIQTVIRAFPRQIWPTKYEDTASFFGIEGIDMEVLGDLTATLGWRTTSGGSMGFLPDVWQQFSILGLALLYVIGRFYGMAWRRAVEEGGFWLLVYTMLLALSIFLTQQTFQSMLYRLLFFSGGGLIVWLLFIRSTLQRLRAQARPREQARIANARALAMARRMRYDSRISHGASHD